MPPDYRYAFFDSFHASPSIKDVPDDDHELEHRVGEAPVVQYYQQAMTMPVSLDAPIVEMTRIEETECGIPEELGKASSSKAHHEISDEEPDVPSSNFAPTVLANTITPTWDRPRKGILQITGQGTISVKADSTIGFHIQVHTADPTLPTLYLDVTQDVCAFSYGGLPSTLPSSFPTPNARLPFPEELTAYPKGKTSAYLREGRGPYKHWLSVDRVNGVLRYGRGYCTASLVLLQAVLKTRECGILGYVDPTWEWVKDLRAVEAGQTGGWKPTEMVIDPFPLVRDLPPYVVKDQDITLDDLESGIVTVVANLPAACQVLYRNVAGPKIVLDAPDFPEFAQAIERSVRQPGLVGYELLAKKATAHGGKFAGTYLRITIGTNLGNSPGIPYVLEIWPSGHSSPIHDHGDSFAVIKVLHGQINAYYFDGLEKPGPNQLGPPATLKKDDVTWISDSSYQVHQLRNESDQLCCTIQCYQYGDNDKRHFEGFRFSADGNPISPDDQPFFPDSDMAFGEFKKAIKKEWYAYQLEKMK